MSALRGSPPQPASDQGCRQHGEPDDDAQRVCPPARHQSRDGGGQRGKPDAEAEAHPTDGPIRVSENTNDPPGEPPEIRDGQRPARAYAGRGRTPPAHPASRARTTTTQPVSNVTRDVNSVGLIDHAFFVQPP